MQTAKAKEQRAAGKLQPKRLASVRGSATHLSTLGSESKQTEQLEVNEMNEIERKLKKMYSQNDMKYLQFKSVGENEKVQSSYALKQPLYNSRVSRILKNNNGRRAAGAAVKKRKSSGVKGGGDAADGKRMTKSFAQQKIEKIEGQLEELALRTKAS